MLTKTMKSVREPLLNGRLGKVAARLVRRLGSLRSRSLRFRLARDTFGVAVIQVVSMGLGFLTNVILARFLGVKEFGLYAFAWSVLALLTMSATVGFPQLLVREIAASRAKGESSAVHGLICFSRRLVMSASVGLALLAGLGFWLFSSGLPLKALATLAIALVGLPLLALAELQGSALRGLDRILEGQMVQILVRPLSFLLLFGGTWLLAQGLMDATLAIGLQVVAAGMTLLVGELLLHRHLNYHSHRTFSPKRNSTWLRSALWLLLLALLNLIPQHAGVLLLGVMREAEEVGLYKVAYQTALLIPFGMMAVSTAVAPMLSQLYAAGDRSKLQRVTIMASGAAFASAFPAALLFIVEGSWFIATIFGKSFISSANALTILAVGQLVNAPLALTGLLLLMTGFEQQLVLSVAIAYSLELLLHIILIPPLGVIGAAVASTTGLFLVNGLTLYFCIRISLITCQRGKQ